MKARIFLFAFLCLELGCFGQPVNRPVVKPGETFLLKMNGSRRVGDSLQVTFNGNSHKSVMAGGPESPLGFSFTYWFGKKKVEDEHWEYDKAPYKWKKGGYLFTVLSCEYDNWVKMKVEKVPLGKY